MQTISITISGEVQGVFYRQTARERAIALGITGQVKNLANGNVLILATGSKESLDALIAWCHRGPSKAEVTGVVVSEMPLQQFYNFTIERR